MTSTGRSTQSVTNDGSDFTHRERVAAQYRISTQHKKSIFPYQILSAITLIISSTYASLWHHEKIDQDSPIFPKWSILWIIGLLPIGLGIQACKTNDTTKMGMSIKGHYIFIFGGIFWGIFDNVKDIMHLVNEGQAYDGMKHNFGFPSVLILVGLFAFSLMIHGKVIFHSKKLLSAWRMSKKH